MGRVAVTEVELASVIIADTDDQLHLHVGDLDLGARPVVDA